ncbi:MAG: hypothetical protein CL938_05985 [Deltaproteobacteria bacterium]|nr:hypothetical protein [Deltaproteobacteria bacterium]
MDGEVRVRERVLGIEFYETECGLDRWAEIVLAPMGAGEPIPRECAIGIRVDGSAATGDRVVDVPGCEVLERFALESAGVHRTTGLCG